MSEPGPELNVYSEQIVKCIMELREQRDEINLLISKQEEEKLRLKTEMQRINYKLALVIVIVFGRAFYLKVFFQISKSLSQRLKAKLAYDKTIEEAEKNYKQLVLNSGQLLDSVQKTVNQLTDAMDKKVGTSNGLDLPERDDAKNTNATKSLGTEVQEIISTSLTAKSQPENTGYDSSIVSTTSSKKSYSNSSITSSEKKIESN